MKLQKEKNRGRGNVKEIIAKNFLSDKGNSLVIYSFFEVWGEYKEIHSDTPSNWRTPRVKRKVLKIGKSYHLGSVIRIVNLSTSNSLYKLKSKSHNHSILKSAKTAEQVGGVKMVGIEGHKICCS